MPLVVLVLLMIVRLCQGPHVLELLDFWHSPFYMVLVVPRMDYDLQWYLQLWAEDGFTSKGSYKLAVQLACGLAHIHKLRVLHRDVHTKNILVQREGSGIFGEAKVAFTDFGRGAVGIQSSNQPMTACVYVASYRPPEVFFSLGSCFNKRGEWLQTHQCTYGYHTCFVSFVLLVNLLLYISV